MWRKKHNILIVIYFLLIDIDYSRYLFIIADLFIELWFRDLISETQIRQCPVKLTVINDRHMQYVICGVVSWPRAAIDELMTTEQIFSASDSSQLRTYRKKSIYLIRINKTIFLKLG